MNVDSQDFDYPDLESEQSNFRYRLDREWETLNAIREMLGIALKGATTPTYLQALGVGKIVSPSLFDSESSLLGHSDEPSLAKQYRQKADGLSQIRGTLVRPIDALDEDIALNRRLLRTEGDKSLIQKQLTALESIRPYLCDKKYTENQLIIRDLFKVNRDLPHPPIDGDTYRDFRISDERGLRIRLLHPDPPEHSLGADLIYETYWEKKRLARIILVQYKVWDGETLYLSQSHNLKQQMEKLEKIFCCGQLCEPPNADKARERFRLQYCTAFLRPTDKLQEPNSRKISSGLHTPICRAFKSIQATGYGGEKISRQYISSESLSHKVFEELFNRNMLGSRWFPYEQIEKLYQAHGILRLGERILLHAQEFGLEYPV